MKWTKTKTVIRVSEGTTITYRLEGTAYTVESRKRHIPHANRPGTWDHTSYFVLKDGQEVAKKVTLGGAKKHAEALAAGEEGRG